MADVDDLTKRKRSITIGGSKPATHNPASLLPPIAETKKSIRKSLSYASNSMNATRGLINALSGGIMESERESNNSLGSLDQNINSPITNNYISVNKGRAKELRLRIELLKKKLRVLVRTIINSRRMEKFKLISSLDKTVGNDFKSQKDLDRYTSEGKYLRAKINDRKDNPTMSALYASSSAVDDTKKEGQPTISVTVDRPTFRLEDFLVTERKNQVTSYLIEKVLSKPSDKRADYDLQMLDRMMLSVPYFKLFSRFPKLRREIGKALEYRCFEKNRIIVKQGRPCVYVYIVIRGNVWCFSQNNEKESDNKSKEELGLDDDDMIFNTANSDRRSGNWAKSLHDGQVFGDVEIRFNLPRAATAVVQSDFVELLLMERSAFEATILSFQDQLNGENLRILQSIPVVNTIPLADLKSLAESCMMKEYPSQRTILRQNELHAECLFYVVSGKLKYSRAVPVKKKSQATTKAGESPVERYPFHYEVSYFRYQKAHNKAILMELGECQAGELFGEESMYQYLRQMDRKTCLREHFRYPLSYAYLPDSVDMIINEQYNDSMGISGSKEIDDQGMKKMYNRRSIASVDINQILTMKPKKKDPTMVFRRNLFNVSTITATTCLLIPKLKILRFLSDYQFDEFKKCTHSHLVLALIRETVAKEEALNTRTEIGLLNSRHSANYSRHDDNLTSIQQKSVKQQMEGGSNAMAIQYASMKRPNCMEKDPLEVAIDRSLWTQFLLDYEWNRYKEEAVDKVYQEKRHHRP